MLSISLAQEGANISLLQYVDDALFFGEWSRLNAKNLILVLKCFEMASGLKINLCKSRLFGIGVPISEVEEIASSIGCRHDVIPFLYLGLPVGKKMRLCDGWNEVVNRFRDRLSAWKAKSLSIGGRLTLVKSILGSLPLYYFSIFKAPQKIINILESIICRFFGGFKEDQSGICWVKWKSILLNSNMGGLGVGSLYAKNLGLLGKWKWRFLTEKNALWHLVIKEFYEDDGGFGSPVGSFGNIGIWGDIIKSVDGIEKIDPSFKFSFSQKISDGSNILFWGDAWCGNGMRLKDLFPRLYALDTNKNCKVKDRWRVVNEVWGGNWEWRIPPRGRALDDISALNTVIGNLTLSNDAVDSDSWTWSMDGSEEDMEHILIKCPRVLSIWRKIWSWWHSTRPSSFPSFNVKDIAFGSITSHGCPRVRKVISGVFKCALWMIWKWRNKVVNSTSHGVENAKKEDIFPAIQRLSKTWISARYSLKPTSWSCWITNPSNMFL
ncbi:hypothetical protein Tco_0481090 [Tanacetum coccineum]